MVEQPLEVVQDRRRRITELEAEVERLRDGITTMVDAWWRETEPLWNVAFMLANLRDNREAPNLHSPSSEEPPRPVGHTPS